MKSDTFDALYAEAETHEEYWVAGMVQEFTEEVVRLMKERRVTRSELARRLGTSPAYVTKILRGNANFTLASMAKLSRALGAELRLQLTPHESLSATTRRKNLATSPGSPSGRRAQPSRIQCFAR